MTLKIARQRTVSDMKLVKDNEHVTKQMRTVCVERDQLNEKMLDLQSTYLQSRSMSDNPLYYKIQECKDRPLI